MQRPDMQVVATAGHVDHGKSTLVRALTGMEPDRWAEERRRGMTIDLGFAWTRLPSGRVVAFVDVPGHERFVANMLAGVGPVPAVMLVVAADEGWMPQTAEHVAALHALGVRHALLVVSRADLADPAPALAQARQQIAAAGGQQLAPFCRQGMEQRFPFRRDAAQDMPVDDFVRLFAPGGALDQFFQQQLRPYVDASRKPWRPVAADGAPPVSAADVAQFQRAAAIRDAFFPGLASSGFRFELAPVSLDAGAASAVLEVEGIPYPLAPRPGGSARVAVLQWPSRGSIALNFEPASSAGPLVVDGAWSALRFVARGNLQPAGSPDRFRLTIAHGDRSAVFELRTGSASHPFGLRELTEFRCPGLAAQ